MGRIPDIEIEKLKQEISLLRLIESQGYTPKNRAKTTPSAVHSMQTTTHRA